MSDSSNSNSSNSGSSSASRGTTAKNKKAAEKARLAARRANAKSVGANLTLKFGKIPGDVRANAQKKIREIRADPDLDTEERAEKEKKIMDKVTRALARAQAAKEAKKAEMAVKREEAKSARSAATAAKKAQKEANVAKAKANLKNYLGESPLKKHVNAFYKARQNKKNMTARNYAKAAGLARTRKLSESAKKLLKKQKSVGADFVAKGVDGDEFCERASAYTSAKRWLEAKHKEKGLKHSLSTIIDVCGAEIVKTPTSSS